MKLTHTHHARHVRAYHRIARSDFWLFELSIWFHALALSLVSIFVPILMYKDGYSITQIVLYFFMYNVIDVPLNFVAAGLVRRFGARVVIALGTGAAVLFSLALLNLETAGVALSGLVLLAITAAVYDTLYWVAHLFLFQQSDTETANAGKNTGVMYAVRQVAVTVGPIMGAAILLLAGEKFLIAGMILLFLVSLAPLALMQHTGDKPTLPPAPQPFLSSPRILRANLSRFIFMIHEDVETTLLPLLIFTTFNTLSSVAVIPVLASIAAIVIALFLGSIPRHKRTMAVIGGAAVITIIWIGRLLFPNPILFYGSILLVSIFAYFVGIPLDSEIFEYGNEVGDPLRASMYRNISDMSGNVVLFGILLLTLHIFPGSFTIAIVGLVALILLNIWFHIYIKTPTPANAN